MPDPATRPAEAPGDALFPSLERDARVLLVRLRSMGDVLLLTSPLHALRQEFPEFRVSVLVEAQFAACLDGNPDATEVLTTAGGKAWTIRTLLGRRFDAIINLHGGPTSLVYSLAARGMRVGTADCQFPRFYHRLAPRAEGRRHTVENTMRLFRGLGLATDPAPPLYYAPQVQAAAWVREHVTGEDYAVIHPGARMSTKRWASQNFAAIARRLAGSGLRPVVAAGPGEEGVAAETARHLPAGSVVPGLTIPRLAELIRRAKLYVGNDSGPMHLAAAVGTPTVAVWGSSDSIRWRPWRVEHRVVQNPYDCNPCPGYRCLVADTPLCIESVTVEQVSAAIDALLPDDAG